MIYYPVQVAGVMTEERRDLYLVVRIDGNATESSPNSTQLRVYSYTAAQQMADLLNNSEGV